MNKIQELKEDFQILLASPGWDRLVKAVEDAITAHTETAPQPLLTQEDIANQNFRNGVVVGLRLFRDFPAQQVAAANLKLKARGNDDGE